MKNLETLKEKVKEMQAEIERIESDGGGDKGLSVLGWSSLPSGQGYYLAQRGFVTHSGGPSEMEDIELFLGAFKTKAQALTKLNLVKALCPSSVWVPEGHDTYWNWGGNSSTSLIWVKDYYDKCALAQGNVHKTKEAAEAYGVALKAWSDLLVN